MKYGIKKVSRAPIVLQTHKDPVPLHVVQNNLRTLGMTLDDFTKVVYGV